MPANLEHSVVDTGPKKVSFHPSLKKDHAKKCSNYLIVVLISHASKVMLQILQDRLQQYVNRELPVVQAGFRKDGGTSDQIANIHWIREKAREFQKNIYFIDYAKAFVWITANCGKFLEMGISLYLSPEKPRCRTRSNRTRHGTTDWFQIGKGVRQGCMLSPCLFNLYAEYIMRNSGLDETQTRINIAGRNVNNLRYTDDTTLMVESDVRN